jgi:hypothetical protein
MAMSIAEYIVQAWDVRNSCKHVGAVLPLVAALEGRSGPMVSMLWLDRIMVSLNKRGGHEGK